MTHTTLNLKVPNITIEHDGGRFDTWTWTAHFEEIMDNPDAQPNTYTIVIPIMTTADVQCLADQFDAAAGAGADRPIPDILLKREG